jgi:hypothetical protein
LNLLHQQTFEKQRLRPSAKAHGVLESAAYSKYVSIYKTPCNAGSRLEARQSKNSASGRQPRRTAFWKAQHIPNM